MTWKELCKKAEEMGAKVCTDLIVLDEMFYWSFGVVEPCNDDVVFAKDRTPEQMYQIMEALR
jgi:hypothetical protein